MIDSELLAQYVENHSAAAFREILDRHLPMVYAAALRQVGDAHLAEDVCQNVFLALSHKAHQLPRQTILAGWLYRAACYAARNLRRTETRRRRREAIVMQQASSSTSSDDIAAWEHISTLLDEAIGRLTSADRDLVLLRYFQGKSHSDTGTLLGTTPATAQKRLERAVGKLRSYLAAKGVATLSADALGAMILTHGTSPVPHHLGAVITTVVGSSTPAIKAAAVAKCGAGIAKAKLLLATAAGAIMVAAATYGVLATAPAPATKPQASAPTANPVAAPAVRYDGVLVDEVGRPVSRAYVYYPGANPWQGARTDLEGRFALPARPGPSRSLIAYSQRSARMAVFTLPVDQPHPTIQLGYVEGTVDGRLMDDSGRILPNANVDLEVTLPDGTVLPSFQARTNADGDYLFQQIPFAEAVNLQVITPGMQNGNACSADIVAGQRLVQMDYTITSLPGTKPAAEGLYWLSGKLQGPSGDPIPSALVKVLYERTGKEGVYVLYTTSDPAGRWRARLPAHISNLSVRFVHPDYTSYHFVEGGITPKLQQMQVGSAVTVLARGRRISGVVVDEHGKPVSNALVLAGESYGRTPVPENEPLEDCCSPRTDAEGRFTIGGLPESDMALQVTTDDFAPAYQVVNIKSGTDVRISLERGSEYHGRIVDRTGKPLAGVAVSADEWAIGTGHNSITRITKSDDQGRFSLTRLPSRGTLEIFAIDRHSQIAWLRNDGETDAGDVRLLPVVISGKVVDDATGEPIRTYKIAFGPVSNGRVGSDPTTVNSGDGRFKKVMAGYFEHAHDSGPYAVSIEADGYAPAMTPPVRQGEGPREVVVRLKRTESVVGGAAKAHQ